MDRFNRIYKLHGLLKQRRNAISKSEIKEQIECSDATVERIIREMRDYLGAPIEYSRQAGGYQYSNNAYELPGLWFSAEELHGLLICQMLLQSISPGLLKEKITQLHIRIDKLLKLQQQPDSKITDKVQFIHSGRRLKDETRFIKIAAQLVKSRQISIHYQARGNADSDNDRIVSPQKLIYYRENWYLLAWCHVKEDLRLFAVDRIKSIKALDYSINIISEHTLKDFTDSAYGIFTGEAQYTAELEFTAERAKWIVDENWHLDQQGQWLDNGNYQLKLPFNDSRELVMDILKHGSEVEVMAPGFLRKEVRQQITLMQKKYHN